MFVFELVWSFLIRLGFFVVVVWWSYSGFF